jgi:hypothetical protein
VYPFIEAENVSTTGNVKRACELLEVSRAAYYGHRTGELSQRARVDAELTEQVVAIHAESMGTYGAPRVLAELAAVDACGARWEVGAAGLRAPRGQPSRVVGEGSYGAVQRPRAVAPATRRPWTLRTGKAAELVCQYGWCVSLVENWQ